MAQHSFSRNNFDLIRLAAAAQVAVCHTIESMAPQWSHSPVVQLLELFPGVPIFFFISGFLISRSIENNPRLADYARNRALRIFPALHVCVLFNITLVAVTGYFGLVDAGPGDLIILYLAKSTFFQFYNPEFMRHFGDGVLNGSLWTVCVELQFYFLVPIIYRTLVARGRWQNDLIILGVILLSIVINRLLWSSRREYADSNLWKLLRVSFLPWAYMFLFGVLTQRNFERLKRVIVPVAFPIGFALYLGYAIVMRQHGASFDNDMSPMLYVPVAMLTLLAAYTKPTLSGALLHQNDISYGIYIYHMPVVDLMLYTGYTGELRFALLAVAGAVALAVMSWFAIERPALARKHRPLYPISEGERTAPQLARGSVFF